MAYDGKALSRAREQIRGIKQNNAAEQSRRRQEVFSREPEFERLDVEMTRLMTDIAVSALSRGVDVGAAVLEARDKSREIIDRRTELLRKNGWAEDYLDDIFSCEKCRDTGYVKGEICSCLEAAYRGESSRLLTSMLNLGSQSFEKFDLSLYESADAGVPTGEVRDTMYGTLSLCRGYAESFGEHSENLLFRGGTGLGKTFLSACIAKVVLEKGFSVVYDTCISVMDAFEAQKFDRNAENGAETSSQIRRYLSCDLLILDDLGTEMTTAFTQSALYTLINTRLINGRKTIISTNLTDDELLRRYSPQIVSRIKGEYEVLRFRGRDIRDIKKERGI